MESVSIIISTYKRGELMKHMLPFYLNQKFLKEIIIIDNGRFALDKIKDIVKKHKNIIKVYQTPKKINLPAARNIGIAKSTGDYIIFGDDDTEFTPNYVEILMKNLKKENVDIISGRQIFVYRGETKKNAAQKARNLTEKDLYIFYPTDVNFSVDMGKNISLHTLSPFALIKREVFQKVLYDENIGLNCHREETDFYSSALEKGFKMCFCNEAFLWHLNCLSYKMRAGGARSGGRIWLEYSLFHNNAYFWRKHYFFLRRYLKLKWPLLFYVLGYSINRYINFLKREI